MKESRKVQVSKDWTDKERLALIRVINFGIATGTVSSVEEHLIDGLCRLSAAMLENNRFKFERWLEPADAVPSAERKESDG